MAKKPSSNEIIDAIADIRTANNGLWMNILKIAYDAEPYMVREIIGYISDNDRDITKWLKKL